MSRIQIPLPKHFVFHTTLKVQIGDINYGNHLGNDAVLRLAHEARLQFLNSMDYSEMQIEGASLILSDAAIVFLNEAFYGDELEIHVAVTEFSRAGFTMIYQVENQVTEKEIARIQTGMVFFDYTLRKIQSTPKAFIEKVHKLQGYPT